MPRGIFIERGMLTGFRAIDPYSTPFGRLIEAVENEGKAVFWYAEACIFDYDTDSFTKL